MTARQRTLLSLVAGVTLGLGYAGYRIVSDPDVSAAELRSPMFWLELLVAMAVTVAFLVLMVKLRDAILAVVGKIRKIFTRKSLGARKYLFIPPFIPRSVHQDFVMCTRAEHPLRRASGR